MASSAERPLRIVHVYRAPLGGLFRHVLDLARGQVARGHEVGMICASKAGSAFTEGLLNEIAPSLRVGLARISIERNPNLSDLAALLNIRRQLKAMRPDVVHGHGSKGGLFARLCAPRSAGAITAYTPHGGSFNYRPGSLAHRVYMRAEGLLERRTDVFTFESEFILGRYRALVGEPRVLTRVARNGIHPHEFEPIDAASDAADLVYVGEFRSAKGLGVLADALLFVSQRMKRKPTIVLVGSGPDEALIRGLMAERGLAETSQFLTPRPIRQALALGRSIVVPSLAESLPYVSLESAGAAVPTVSTNVGGIPEVYGPYADMLIPPGDAARLANAIEAIITQPTEERRARARAIAAYVGAHFTVDGMNDAIVLAYRDALARRAGAALIAPISG